MCRPFAGPREFGRTNSAALAQARSTKALASQGEGRGEGRCQWPLEAGGCCGSTWQLELDHVRPRAHGGASVPANLRVLCRFHNRLAATQVFGAAWMARSRSRPGRVG